MAPSRLAALLLILAACGPSEAPVDDAQAPAPVSDGAAPPVDPDCPERPKVAIFGIDGATFRVLQPLIDAGRVPHLAGLVERGTATVLEKPSEYDASPVLWTSIVTSTLPHTHGISNFGKKEGDDLFVFRSSGRKVPALWTMADQQGRSVGIVGVWNTWPAEVVEGYLISDRFCHSLYELNYAAAGADMSRSGVVFPPELTAEVAPFALAPDDVVRADVETLGAFTDAEWDELLQGDKRPGPTLGNGLVSLKFGWQAQESVAGAALHMLRTREQPDLFMTFFELPDRVSHHFWHAYEPDAVQGGREAVEPEWIERWGGIVPRSYERVDWWLGQMLAELDEDTTVLVVSDHGFQSSRKRGGSLDDLSAIHHSGTHHDEGILIAAGPAIRPGARVRAHILDVVPTALLALGLPGARQAQGRVLRPLIDEDFLACFPPREPLDYAGLVEGTAKVLDIDPSVMDAAYIEHLRQLGYVDASGNVLAAEDEDADG